MKLVARHTGYMLMAVALLCIALVSVKFSIAESDCSVSPEFPSSTEATASFIEKEDNMLDAVREMGQWGMPSTSTTLQGTVGRTLMFGNFLQRVLRAYAMLHTDTSSCYEGLTGWLGHTISAKRFNSGYYIHYRCQMRC